MDSQYLKETVGDALIEALNEVIEKQPTDPIEHLGLMLLRYLGNQYDSTVRLTRMEAYNKKSEQTENSIDHVEESNMPPSETVVVSVQDIPPKRNNILHEEGKDSEIEVKPEHRQNTEPKTRKETEDTNQVEGVITSSEDTYLVLDQALVQLNGEERRSKAQEQNKDEGDALTEQTSKQGADGEISETVEKEGKIKRIVEQQQDPIEGENVKQQDPIEMETVKQQELIEGENVKQQDPIEGETVKQQDSTERNTVKQQDPIEVETVKQQDPIEMETVKQQEPIEGETVKQQEPIEGETVKQQDPIEVDTMKQQNPIEGENVKKQEPTEGENVKQQEPIEGEIAAEVREGVSSTDKD